MSKFGKAALAVTAALASAAGLTAVTAGPASADAGLGSAIATVAKAQLSSGHTHQDSTGCNFYTGAIGKPSSSCATAGWGTGDWCADFAKYVWREADGVEDLSSLDSWADSFRKYGISHGTWHSPSGYTPQPGDAIVYPDNNGNGLADHVGIVVSSSGGKVTSVEGNSGSGSVVGEYTESVGSAWGYTTPVGHGKGSSRDVTGNGWDDVVARNASNQNLYVYDGFASGKLAAPKQLGTGWGAMTTVLTGEFSGDSNTDLLGVQTSGDMYLYPGNGKGVFGAGKKVGSGWGSMKFVVTADFTGDGHNDLIGIQNGSGDLYLYAGGGNGTFAAPRKLASGWGAQTALLAGDFNHDGHGDLVGRTPDGILNVYTGHGDAQFNAPKEISHGWGGITALIPGDFTGDGYTDVLGRTADGTLLLYTMGSGGALSAGAQIGTGWNGLDLFQS